MRQFDFEDNFSHDWPAELRSLALAASHADRAMMEIDELLSGKGDYPARVPYIMLADAAYKLRQAIRAVGEPQLAEWEASQQLVRGNEGK